MLVEGGKVIERFVASRLFLRFESRSSSSFAREADLFSLFPFDSTHSPGQISRSHSLGT